MDGVYKVFLAASSVILLLYVTSSTLRSQPKRLCETDTMPGHKQHNNSVGEVVSQPLGNEDFKVPNLVHYIMITGDGGKPPTITFLQYLSVLSAVKFQKPDHVYVHYDVEPTGEWWQKVKTLSTVKLVHRKATTSLNGEVFPSLNHSKPAMKRDMERIIVIKEYGGIYVDWDVLFLRSLDPLRRQHACTIGKEEIPKVCGCVFLCAPQHPFLYLWLNSFLDDYRDQWAYNSGEVPYKLSQRYPDLVYVEKAAFNIQIRLRHYYTRNSRVRWRDGYVLHTLVRFGAGWMRPAVPTPDSIRRLDMPVGQAMRLVYYNTTDLL